MSKINRKKTAAKPSATITNKNLKNLNNLYMYYKVLANENFPLSDTVQIMRIRSPEDNLPDSPHVLRQKN